MSNRRKRRVKVTTQLTRNQFIFFVVCLVALMVVFIIGVSKESKPQSIGEEKPVESERIEVDVPFTEAAVDIDTDDFTESSFADLDNYVYPFNTMSADWGSELYSSGFKYYHIPQEYIDEGGCFPEVVQAYLWSLCHEKDINYYVIVALIERESRYYWDASGDKGNSKGYMQIYEKWHLERMEEEGVTDLYNPYGNIRVGLSFIYELMDGAVNANYHYVLMSYNMGESRAKEFFDKGIYSTEYSIAILQRAQEIQQEMQE